MILTLDFDLVTLDDSNGFVLLPLVISSCILLKPGGLFCLCVAQIESLIILFILDLMSSIENTYDFVILLSDLSLFARVACAERGFLKIKFWMNLQCCDKF